MTDTVYQVHLSKFEGPFDLLLFFIERDELDIYDIPISKITDDFLHYLHTLESNRIEIASEFIAMAARLMKIKAAMLLPRPQVNEKGEVVDPRAELVDRLLEYKLVKTAQEYLSILEDAQMDRYRRSLTEWEMMRQAPSTTADELQGVTLSGLMKVLIQVMEQLKNRHEPPRHVIQPLPYTVEAVKMQIIDQVSQARKVHFIQLARKHWNRYYVVFCFLCTLELIQQRKIHVVIGNEYNDFWLLAVEDELQELAIGA
jgi:segregation and condensation protein A